MNAWRILPGLPALALAALVAATPVQAQIAFRSASSAINEGMGVQHRVVWNAASSDTAATVEPTLPATRAVGDLLLTIIEARHLNAVSMPSPAWTLLGSGTQGTGTPAHQARIYWRIADNTANDRAIVNRGGGTDVVLARVVAFGNVDTTNPFDGFSFGSSGGATNTVATGAITTTNACSALVTTMHIADDNTITTPAGWNPLTPTTFFSSTTTGSDAAIGMFMRSSPAVGVQPSVTITHSAADFSHAAQIALRPGGLTLNVPAGTQAGDVMVATLATRPANSTATNNNAKTVCAPPGWTLIRDTTNNLGGGSGGTGLRMQTYYRVATGAEPASYTWYAQLNNAWLPLGTGGGQIFVSGTGGIASYSGVDGASPINVENGNTIDVKTFSHTANQITPTVANTMLVASHTFASADTWTAPTGMTERVDQSAPAANNAVGIALEMSDQPWPTAVATGTRVAVASGTGGSNADEGVAHLMALRPGPAVAHYAISVVSSTVANCDFAEVTVTAHNAAHATVNPPATRTVTLSVSAGAATAAWQAGLISGSGTWTPSGATATYTWPGTQSSFTVRLRQSAVVSLTVNANDTFVTEDATEDPTISFVNSAFRISNGANAALSIGNQIAAKPSNTGTGSQSLYLQAIRTDTTTGSCVSVFPNGSEVDINVGAVCNNPASCTQNVTLTTTSGSGAPTGNFVPAGAGSYPATIRFRFTTANAEAPFFFSYADAGQITLQFRHITAAAPATTIAGTSNAFVTRPFGFAFRGANAATAIQHGTLATSPLLAAAGDNFTMTLAAYRWVSAEDDGTGNPLAGANLTDNGLTPNFAASTTVSATGNLPGVATGAVARGVGCAGAATIAAGSWSGGAATIADWCYSEVGNVFLGATANNYISAGVNVTGNSGLDGTGAAGGYVGRFRPKHFAVSGAPTLTNRSTLACASTFTYLGEQLSLGFTLAARNAQNVVAQNYNGAYARLDLSTVAGLAIGARSGATNLTGRVDSSLAPTGSFVSGSAALVAPVAIDRATPDNPDGPFAATQFGIAPVDPDGVLMQSYNQDVDGNAVNDHFAVAPTTELRFGRLRLANGYGPDSGGMRLPLDVQYWGGGSFTLNTQDSCTTLARANIALAFSGVISACDTAVIEPSIPFVGGTATLTLAAPGAGKTGTVTLAAQLGTAAGTYCPAKGGGTAAATASGADYLLGRWDDSANPDGNANTAYDDKPSSRATFGLYGSQPRNFIFFRENF